MSIYGQSSDCTANAGQSENRRFSNLHERSALENLDGKRFSKLHERSAWKNFEGKDFRNCTKEVHKKNLDGKKSKLHEKL